MKISIVYNGDPAQTKVVDQDTGEEIEGIANIEISIDAFSAYASIVLQDFTLDAENVPGGILDEQETSE